MGYDNIQKDLSVGTSVNYQESLDVSQSVKHCIILLVLAVYSLHERSN